MVNEPDSSLAINELLHQYGKYIVGRMGIPRVSQRLCVISVVMEAPADIINTLTGKIGMLTGVSCKTIFAKEG